MLERSLVAPRLVAYRDDSRLGTEQAAVSAHQFASAASAGPRRRNHSALCVGAFVPDRCRSRAVGALDALRVQSPMQVGGFATAAGYGIQRLELRTAPSQHLARCRR